MFLIELALELLIELIFLHSWTQSRSHRHSRQYERERDAVSRARALSSGSSRALVESPVALEIPGPESKHVAQVSPTSHAHLPRSDRELTVRVVCEAVFGPDESSLDVPNLFAARFKDRHVTWSARLTAVEVTGFDVRLGTDKFTRATFALCEMGGGIRGGRTVSGYLRLPAADYPELRGLVGERVRFQGQLVDCDPFGRGLYMLDGSLVV